MKRVQGWENATPEVGDYLQIDEYDAEIVEVDETERQVEVEIFDGDESYTETFKY